MSAVSTQLPSIDVLMCAYNYGRYVERALMSAIEQDYPPELLRVIVVDDGSTDDTAATVAAVAERHPGRIKLISQANGGLRAAMNRALEEADAELVALLDADDAWLPEKTAVQVRLLQGEPQVGLVFCDMTVVDGEERLVRPSQVGNIPPFPREALAWLLVQNVVTQSSLVIRRELAKPLPEGITYSDWWLALCAAEVAQVAYLPEKLALYREHGANLTSSVTGTAAVREYRKEIRFHLWTLRHLAIERLTSAEIQQVWQAIEFKAQRAVQANGSLLVELVGAEETDGDTAERLRTQASEATQRGDSHAALVLRWRALAWDPLVVGARAELDAAIQGGGHVVVAEPDPFAEAAGFVVLALAEDLLADESLMVSYAEAATGAEDVTLAIDATRMPEHDAERQLQELLERLGLDDREDLDLLAIVGDRGDAQRQRMRSSADVLLSPATVAGLGELVRARR